jgi:hypothetical protein
VRCTRAPHRTSAPVEPVAPVAPAKKVSRFAVWGGLLNLHQQVESL